MKKIFNGIIAAIVKVAQYIGGIFNAVRGKSSSSNEQTGQKENKDTKASLIDNNKKLDGLRAKLDSLEDNDPERGNIKAQIGDLETAIAKEKNAANVGEDQPKEGAPQENEQEVSQNDETAPEQEVTMTPEEEGIAAYEEAIQAGRVKNVKKAHGQAIVENIERDKAKEEDKVAPVEESPALKGFMDELDAMSSGDVKETPKEIEIKKQQDKRLENAKKKKVALKV